MTKYKVSIVGTGNMAQEHVDVVKNIKQFEIISVTARNIKNLKKFASKNSIKNISTNVKKMLKDYPSDLVIIAVSELSLKKVIQQVMLSSSTILVEKPVGYNFEESKKIVQLSKKIKKRNIFVSMNRRFYESTKKANLILKNLEGKRKIIINDQQDLEYQKKILTPNLIVRNFNYANSIHLIDYISNFSRGKLKKIKTMNFLKSRSQMLTSYMSFSSGDEVIYNVVYNVKSPWYVEINIKSDFILLKPLEKLYFSRNKNIKIDYSKDIKFKPGLLNQAKQILNYLNRDNFNLVDLNEYFRSVKLVRKIYNA